MPDPAKHEALEALGFSIARTCSNCVHWGERHYRAPSDWGRCSLTTYQHGKHTGERGAGTPGVGTCPEHLVDMQAACLAVGDDYAARYLPDDPRG